MYAVPEVTLAEVTSGGKKHMPALRVTYSTKEQFKAMSKKLGIMDDFKVSEKPCPKNSASWMILMSVKPGHSSMFSLNPGGGKYKAEIFIFSLVSSLRSWRSHLFV